MTTTHTHGRETMSDDSRLQSIEEVPGYAYWHDPRMPDVGSLVRRDDDTGDTILSHYPGLYIVLEDVTSYADAVDAARQWAETR